MRILHFLGGSSIDVAGKRAIAQTKMTISQRAPVDGVICDVVCTGRFYDFFEKRDGRWGLVLRQPIYEKDRLDPVDPAAKLALDQDLLARFPEGYRHLAYLQTKIGYQVKTDMPGSKGPSSMRSTRAARAGSRAKRSDHPSPAASEPTKAMRIMLVAPGVPSGTPATTMTRWPALAKPSLNAIWQARSTMSS